MQLALSTAVRSVQLYGPSVFNFKFFSIDFTARGLAMASNRWFVNCCRSMEGSYSRLCSFSRRGIECPKGFQCLWAHSTEDLVLKDCDFGTECPQREEPLDRGGCKWFHAEVRVNLPLKVREPYRIKPILTNSIIHRSKVRRSSYCVRGRSHVQEPWQSGEGENSK